MKFLTNIDLNRNQLTNVVLHNVGSDPTGGTYSEGQLIYNTTDDQVKFYDGSAWVSVNSGSMSSFDLAADTGTTSTISDGGIVTISGSGSVSTAVSSGTVTISLTDVTNAELQNDSITLTNTDGHLTFANSGVVALGGSIAIDTSGLVDTTTAQTIAGAKTFSDDAVFNGNLTVNGTTTTIDSTNLLVEDALIVVAKDQATGVLDAGIIVERGTDSSMAMLWDESADKFAFADVGGEDGSTSGNVTISSYAALQAGDTEVSQLTVSGLASNDTATSMVVENAGVLQKASVSTLIGDNAVSSLAASGTAPLNLSVDASSGDVTLSGSVDMATDAQAVSGTETDVLLSPASLRATEHVALIEGDTATSTTSYTINHAMGTRNVIVQIYDNTSYETVFADVTRTDVDNIAVEFGFSPNDNEDYTVLIKAIA